MLKIVNDSNVEVPSALEGGVGLDELCRLAAGEMLAVAVEAERRAYLDAYADVVDGDGHRVVVGNGYLPVRKVTTGAGVVEVCAPRVHDPRPDHRFTPVILPRYMRRSPKVTEVLPVLYLRGLSTGDFAPALEEFFGSDAGLSASTISRLTEAWQSEHARWTQRDLSDVDYVYWWADGIWFNVRLPDADGNQDRLCCLVIIGVRPDGRKELVAVSDGYRESTDSWARLGSGLGQLDIALGLPLTRPGLCQGIQRSLPGHVPQLGDRGTVHPRTVGRIGDRGLPFHQLHPYLVLLLRRQKPLPLPSRLGHNVPPQARPRTLQCWLNPTQNSDIKSASTQAEVLRGLRDRGLPAPTLAVGDGALGFWGALRDVFDGKVAEQRCWVHKTANVLDALPKRLHPEAKKSIHAIYLADTREDALDRLADFADTFSEFPKAVGKITGGLDTLLAFYDYPKEHWKHLRSTNAIESTFATVRLRTKVTKGAGNRRAALAMAYKLVDAAQARGRRIDGHQLVALVRAGASFIDGELQERSPSDQPTTGDVAA